MLLENLTICNYGVYAGRNEFDLLTTPEKPIVLVGGFNGAGKTTILESMMVVLYGRTYFGRRHSKKEYLEYIHSRIHKIHNTRADSAFVEVSFRFYHNGSEDRYVINRGWKVDGMSVSESFLVKKNDSMMSDVDESQWQSFIEGLLPIGIARLFFFDGEKIVRVTEQGGRYNDEIKTSIETMIGADLVHRLRADLDLYMLRKSGTKDDSVPAKYEQLQSEKKQLASDIEVLEFEREKKQAEHGLVHSELAKKESAISGIGGGYADIRTNLLTRRAVLREKTAFLKKQIHEELSEDAPFYMMPLMMSSVRATLDDDMKILTSFTDSRISELVSSELKEKLSKSDRWPEGTDIERAVSIVLDTIKEIGRRKDEKQFFDLSFEDAGAVGGMTDKVRKKPQDLLDILDRYSEIISKVEKTEAELVKIPKDDELGPMVSEIMEMNRELGTLNAEIMHIEQQISSKRSYMAILQKKIKTTIEGIHKDKTTSTGVELASKMKDVLDTYYQSLKEKKMRDLESNLLHTTKLLLHKRMIQKITIDRDTFEIKAYEGNGNHRPGDLLSMGERQIVGTALLWAIARTCGRSLPFVIDTPLGRLDGQHLDNLVDKFYPFASHQTILLSTDREIGHKEYARLSEYVSGSYMITCDESTSVTSVAPGYFMEEEIAQT